MDGKPPFNGKARPLAGADDVYCVEYEDRGNRIVLIAFVSGGRGLIYQQIGRVTKYPAAIETLWKSMKSDDPADQAIIDYARQKFLAVSQGHVL